MCQALTAKQVSRRCIFRYVMHTRNRRTMLGRVPVFCECGEDELHLLVWNYVGLFNWFSKQQYVGSLESAIEAFVAAARLKRIFAEPAGVAWHVVEEDLKRHYGVTRRKG